MVLQIIGIVGGLALGSVNEGLGALFGLVAFAGLLALLIPSLTVNVRRLHDTCLLYTSPSPRDLSTSRMPASA